MKKIKNLKLFLVLLLNTVIEASGNHQTRTTGFFIEKPSRQWKTTHFNEPAIVQGEIIEEEYPRRNQLQVTAIPEPNYPYMPKRPLKDFIACDGPVSTLTDSQYKELVEGYAPDYYEKIQKQRKN